MGRPSDERRVSLKSSERNASLVVSNLCPIERYYDVADRIRNMFENCMNTHQLDNAYVYGIRFAKFSTDALPGHDYYRVKKREYINLRKQNQKDLKMVIDKLEEVVQLMDLEELEKREIRRREEAAMKRIREREEVMRKEEQERKANEDLMSKLNALDTMFPKVPTGVGETQQNVDLSQVNSSAFLDLPIGSMPSPVPFSAPPPESAPRLSSTGRNNNDINGGRDEMQSLPPPPPPPSYNDLMERNKKFANYEKDSIANLMPASSTSSRNVMNESSTSINYDLPEPKTLINPLGPLLPASLNEHGEVIQDIPKIDIPIGTMKRTSRREYANLTKKQKVQVFNLTTYQGRNNAQGKDSTNGCTVISPLVAVNHLTSEGAGIADIQIESIIDEVAPKILLRVRRKLGLAGNALIIPSDVHDFLVDEKILKQEMFVGVCGGNLLDPEHVNEFLNLLENGDDQSGKNEEKKDNSKKVAAALFFHEHVVSILKVVLADGTTWYDLVDSLPQRRDDGSTMGATRTRCKDRKSLESLLDWYACQKFSPADENYINSNKWDDIMCDFDPRVFQAFVWKE